jgi:hypothetical protein
VSFLDRLFRREGRSTPGREDHAEPGDRATDPRAARTDDYRTADPRELVDEGGTVMGAPGGSPQDTPSVEERRRADLTDE